jgi:hypothetical protein
MMFLKDSEYYSAHGPFDEYLSMIVYQIHVYRGNGDGARTLSGRKGLWEIFIVQARPPTYNPPYG